MKNTDKKEDYIPYATKSMDGVIHKLAVGGVILIAGLCMLFGWA